MSNEEIGEYRQGGPPEDPSPEMIDRLESYIADEMECACPAAYRHLALEKLATLARRLLEERDEAREHQASRMRVVAAKEEHIASLEQQVASYEGMDRAVTHYQEEVRRVERELDELQKKHITAGTRIESYGQGRRAGEANMEKALAEIERLRCADYTAIIEGALKSTIDAHGPITNEFIASARRRIQHGIREVRKS